MIDAKRVTVRDLLDKSTQYRVPESQRNFDWKKEHAEEFWEDMASGGTFLGTIVLDISREEKDKEVLIFDGQQRLTTIFILLSACRNQAMKKGKIEQAQIIQQKLSFMDDTTGASNKTKLIVSPSIKDAFEATITSYDWHGSNFAVPGKKRQVNRIKPIYDYFADKLRKYDHEQIKELLENLYKSVIVRIEIEETQEAFDIFERTNARGMELNAADLLKNYLFAKDASENLIERWETIVDNSLGNIVRMIKYFYVSKFGYVQKKRLFAELKKYGEKTGAGKLLDELEGFSQLYQLVGDSTSKSIIDWSDQEKIKYFAKEYNAQSLNRAFDALSLFNVSQTYPVVIKCLTALLSISKDEQREKSALKLLSFIQVLEKYHFINNAVSQRPGNEVEKYYADKCGEQIKNATDLDTFMKGIIDGLKEKLVSFEEFSGRFAELNYENDFLLIYYIHDRLNNQDNKGGQYINIYNPDRKIIRKNFNIEHLVARDLSEYEFDLDELSEDTVHNIGNLLVISFHTNSSQELGNKQIKAKFKVLKTKEAIPEVKRFVEEWKSKSWNSLKAIQKNIADRAESLAQRAYQDVWKL